MDAITHVSVRMYRLGTGDCFILKFFSGDDPKFKMMIDCGTWSGSEDYLTPFIKDLKDYVENHIDILVITHEHKDHVHGFDVCEQLFINDFQVDQVWMGWTENEKDSVVQKWQNDYGQKKKALAIAAERLAGTLNDVNYKAILEKEFVGNNLLGYHANFSAAVNGFNELHNSVKEGEYVGGLKGMKIVKETIGAGKISYHHPGDIIEKIPGLEDVKFYILGPPKSWDKAKVQSGKKGETYDHNKKLAECESFAAAVLGNESANGGLPFDDAYFTDSHSYKSYNREPWRKIDYDWLNSIGNFALRVNSITNNLSLAFAIEIGGKILLFPGDAEYGSWESWHDITWDIPSKKKDTKHFTEDILNRTVFYKVAHHLSHNGTAQRLGMEMMVHPDLVAMATLDYDIISDGWKGTMPNKNLIKELLKRTKGRLIVMNDKDIPFDGTKLDKVIAREQNKMTANELSAFKDNYNSHEYYHDFKVEI